MTKNTKITTSVYKFILRSIMLMYLAALRILNFLIPNKDINKEELVIVATGTFYSDQWLITHLRPLAASKHVSRVYMVSSTPVPEILNVTPVYSPAWLKNLFGQVGARLITFAWVSIKKRPDILMGFHILINGLMAILMAKLLGVKSLYICGGGPREVAGGGYATENRIFNKIGGPDKKLEKQLLSAVNRCDFVITMGTSAVEYFKENGVKSNYEIIPGGFSTEEFFESNGNKEYDLILVGRLSEVKQVDIFLKSIALCKSVLPEIRAVIVGDGPDYRKLKDVSNELNLSENVVFAGWQRNIGDWLRKSKMFVLTSSSEGLSQALIQAMMCGLPSIVSDVGDLKDLVSDGINGFLIDKINEEEFSSKIIRVLSDEGLLNSLSKNSLTSSKKFRSENVAIQWDKLFETYV